MSLSGGYAYPGWANSSAPAAAPAAAPGAAPSSGIGAMGVLAIAGALSQAVGGFYAAKSQKQQLKAQALSFEFEQSMSNINARNNELEAQSILEVGQKQEGLAGLAGAQAKASLLTSAGAAGIEAGTGSAAEVQASQEWTTQVEKLSIRANAARGAGAARTAATGMRIGAAMAGVNAENARTTARSINPHAAAFTSMLGSGAPIARQWYADRRVGASAAGY